MLISCITGCGICDFCRRRMPSHCRTGGWIDLDANRLGMAEGFGVHGQPVHLHLE